MAATTFLQVSSKILLIASFLVNFCSADIRGVATEKLSFYNPGRDFTCLDGTVTIPFSYVNDDYCDCPDGSDEPGTSACPNGFFTCKNIGHKQSIIQSGRVNDGVCDCCDGSDEYDSDSVCNNNCLEAGREERERLEREKNIAHQGHQIKIGYIEEAKEKRDAIETKNKELKTLLQEQKAKLEELKDAKERAEASEKEAKDKHDKEWEEIKKVRDEDEEAKKIDEAFKKLDIDKNGVVSIHEFASSVFIIKDITEDEAREKFMGDEVVDIAKFHDLWSTLKDLYDGSDVDDEKPKTEEAKEEKKVPMITPQDDKEKEASDETIEQKATDFPDPADHDDDGDDDGDDDDSDNGDHTETADKVPTVPVPPPEKTDHGSEADKKKTYIEKPDYNEETKRLISIADQARKEHDEVHTQVQNTENDVSNNDKILAIDFGDHHEFFSMHGQCFEYTDREYVYKLCPFDTATQSSKDGGSSTSLGHWGDWTGSSNKYSEMRYKDGQSCWNGPNRSTNVKLSCGAKNEIVAVSEPNRCEYVMEFKTPAICQDPAHFVHEEL